jgi:MFS transporter, FHS family, glucose/mannose:H+ symporter
MPASSFIFKSPQYNGLSDQQYGFLFLPMMFVSIAIMLSFTSILQRLGRNKIYYLGILGNALYFLGIMSSAWAHGNSTASFAIILSAEFVFGIGYGFLTPMLNILTIELAPERRDSGLTILHAFFGAGAATSPLLVSFFAERHQWAIGVFICFLILTLLAILSFAARVCVSEKLFKYEAKRTQSVALPFQAKLFLVAIAIYGIVEAIIGNWSTPYLTTVKNHSTAIASNALSLFWVCVMLGRVATSLLARKISVESIFRFSPVIIAAGFVFILIAKSSTALYAAYILTGLGCANFFPLSISISTQMHDSWRESLSSLAVMALMIGAGLGSFFIGVFRDSNWIHLNHAFQFAIACAVFLFALLFFLLPKEKSSLNLKNIPL